MSTLPPVSCDTRTCGTSHDGKSPKKAQTGLSPRGGGRGLCCGQFLVDGAFAGEYGSCDNSSSLWLPSALGAAATWSVSGRVPWVLGQNGLLQLGDAESADTVEGPTPLSTWAGPMWTPCHCPLCHDTWGPQGPNCP